MAEAVKAEIKSSLTEMAKSHPNDYNPLPLWVVYVGVSPNLKARLLVIWTYACARTSLANLPMFPITRNSNREVASPRQ